MGKESRTRWFFRILQLIGLWQEVKGKCTVCKSEIGDSHALSCVRQGTVIKADCL